MNPSIRLLGVWSGALFCLFFLLGLGVFAHWVPPIPPSTEAAQVAGIFRSRTEWIRVGMVLMTLGTTLYLPFTAVLSDLIKEIEGSSYFLSGSQLTGGILSTLVLFIPSYQFAAAAFRPDRNPDITQMLVDQGWLIFITGFGPFVLQNAAIAVAIFIDKRERPAFPRWVGFLQIWVSLSYIPAVLAFFMKTGPFAWNGLFVWWIPLALFAIWFMALIPFARNAVLRRPERIAMPGAGATSTPMVQRH